MKAKKLFIFLTITILLLSACNNRQKQSEENFEAPTKQEMEKFSKAAEKIANILQPELASLVFTLDGTTYRLDTKNVKSSIIPFTHYKPVNEEEGEMEEQSLIWMQGTDVANGVDITFSLNLKEKFANGNFTAREGQVIISKEGKNSYYSVKNISLSISNLKEKKFSRELSAYSLNMTFGGTIAEFGARAEEYEIKDGCYDLKY